ncbi:YjjG family noncanonical pyrimidine nucleotidase [Sediminicola luteus]|uniref:Noncanonical pyrimidine nucleotidase, YjjG family n=1 Tax=Sediminicola luteus TaxID=319238 RepID=A0A2A4G6F6_9FLAO|nr:YjjG family noncanonical pyrimidine nucleotidase [Sediminicola luteus]PCE64549.1 noncanonical pyrimidine nucleotidase, YjjG family [Sediminicola luteus]
MDNPITDVFFDLDHTLWDFERNSALTFEKIFKQRGLSIGLTEFLEAYTPINMAYWKLYREEKVSKPELRYQRLRKSFDTVGVSVSDTVIDGLAEDYIIHLADFNHLFPYTDTILEYLKPKYNLHIITNGFTEIQSKKMSKSGIRHYFDQIIDSETVGVKKPNPLIFNAALDKAETTAASSIMIGDNLEADIQGARKVGMQTLHFNVHNDEPHVHGPIINGLHEIKQYL